MILGFLAFGGGKLSNGWFLDLEKINLQPKQFFEVKKDKRSGKNSRELLWCGVYCRDGIWTGQALA